MWRAGWILTKSWRVNFVTWEGRIDSFTSLGNEMKDALSLELQCAIMLGTIKEKEDNKK